MKNEFFISESDIDSISLKQQLINSSAGAFVCFEGWIRNHNDGKSVKMLEYEVYESMAVKEAKKIFIEAKEKFKILDILAVHRKGLLQIGDIAVWVGVISVHRGSGFDACEYIIDNIKDRLPIWKKEYYLNGDSDWVNCHSH